MRSQDPFETPREPNLDPRAEEEMPAGMRPGAPPAGPGGPPAGPGAPAPSSPGGSHAGTGWLAAAILLCVVLAAPALVGHRALLPVHTGLFRPWSDDLSPSRLADLDSRSHPLLTDVLYLAWPWLRFNRMALEEGFFPGWNPFLLGGSPHFEQSATAFLYPPYWPLFLCPDPVRGLAWIEMLHLVAALVFTFAFLRSIGCRPPAAVLGGLAFALGLWMSLRVEYPQGLNASIWLPLLLWGVESIRAGRRRRGMLALACGVAMGCLAGFIQPAVLSFGAAAGYALWRILPAREGGRGSRRRAPLAAAVALGLLAGLLLAMPQILPTASLLRSGIVERTALDAASARAQGIPWASLLGLLAPTLWGFPAWNHLLQSDIYRHNSLLATLLWAPAAPGTPSDSTIELACFVGVTTVLLAAASLVRGPRRGHGVFFLLLAGGSLALASGSAAWIVAVHLPGMAIGSPKRWLFLVSFAVAVLGALGLDNLPRLAPRTLRRASRVGFAAGALAVLSAAGGWLGREHLADGLVDWTCAATRAPHGRVLSLVPHADFLRNVELVLGELLRGGLVVLGVAASLRCGLRNRPRDPTSLPAPSREPRPVRGATMAWTDGALVALLCLELVRVWICFHPMPPKEGLFAPHPLFARLHELSEGAVAASASGEAPATPGLPQGSVDPAALPFGGGPRIARFGEPLADPDRHTLPLNVLGVFGLPDAQGYQTLSLKPYEELWEAIEPREPGHPGITWGVGVSSLLREESLRSRLLDLLGVRFLVSFRAIPAAARDGWRPRGRVGSLRLYENQQAFPRAFWVPRAIRVEDHARAIARVSAATFPLDQAVVLESPGGAGAGGGEAGAGGAAATGGSVAAGPSQESLGATAHVRLRRYEPTVLEIDVRDAPAGGALVVADAWAPAWRAELREAAPPGSPAAVPGPRPPAGEGAARPVPVLRADGALRAVAIPPGSWTVTMRYRTPGLGAGLGLAALAAVGLAWACRPRAGRDGGQERSSA